MTYLNYVHLAQFIFCTACAIFILYTSVNMLFRKLPNNHPSRQTPMVLLYFWFTATSSITFIAGGVYVIIWWQPETYSYNPMILYYILGIPTIYVNSVPIADFYLCADRCIAIGLPFQYRKYLKYVIAWMFFLTSFGIYLFYFLVTRYFAFYTAETTTPCLFYICLVNHLKYPIVMFYVKYTFCSLNIIAALILIILINYTKKIQANKLSNKLNRPVLMISFFNLTLLFIPNICYDVFQRTTLVNLTEYVGDISMLTVCINIALCVYFYWRIFRKHILPFNSGLPWTSS